MDDIRRGISERIEAIAQWRRDREQQDMMGLGPDAAMRSRRSARGLDELATYVRGLAEDDENLNRLHQVAFYGVTFDPGATLLNELGRFRFHDPDVSVELFFERMIEFAEQDRHEMGEFGGPQVSGDNPWRANWNLHIDRTDDDDFDA